MTVAQTCHFKPVVAGVQRTTPGWLPIQLVLPQLSRLGRQAGCGHAP